MKRLRGTNIISRDSTIINQEGSTIASLGKLQVEIPASDSETPHLHSARRDREVKGEAWLGQELSLKGGLDPQEPLAITAMLWSITVGLCLPPVRHKGVSPGKRMDGRPWRPAIKRTLLLVYRCLQFISVSVCCSVTSKLGSYPNGSKICGKLNAIKLPTLWMVSLYHP